MAGKSKSASKGKTGPRRDEEATQVDAHVGRRIRLRRTLLGMSQTDLAQGIGLTFQQVQKYENGTNRISASKLYGIARVLQKPVGWFFEDLEDAGAPLVAAVDEFWQRRETIELMRSVHAMSGDVRDGFERLVISLSRQYPAT